MRGLKLFALAVLLMFGASVARADVAVSEAGFVVVIENGHRTCESPTPFGCLYAEDGGVSDPGNYYLDAREQLGYVGAATPNESGAFGGYWLLPDESLSLNGSELYVGIAATPTAADVVNGLRSEPAKQYVSWAWSRDNITLWYFGPSTRNPESGFGNRSYGFTHSENFSQAGPYNQLRMNSSDGYLRGSSGLCEIGASETCAGSTDSVFTDYEAAAPNVRVGLLIESVEVATNPDLLSNRSAQLENTTEQQQRARRLLSGLVPAEDAINQTTSGDEPTTPTAEVVDESRRTIAEPRSAPFTPFVQEAATIVPPGEVAPPEALVIITGVALATILGATLYSRFNSREELLVSRQRSVIMDAVRTNPGIRLSALSKHLRLTRTAVMHHIAKLERAGVLKVSRVGRAIALFPADGPRPILLRSRAQ